MLFYWILLKSTEKSIGEIIFTRLILEQITKMEILMIMAIYVAVLNLNKVSTSTIFIRPTSWGEFYE